MVLIGSVMISDGNITTAARAIAGVRRGIKECYASELREYPRARGRLRVALRLAKTGEVSAVELRAEDGGSDGNALSTKLIACTESRLLRLEFGPLTHPDVKIVFPVVLFPEGTSPPLARPHHDAGKHPPPRSKRKSAPLYRDRK